MQFASFQRFLAHSMMATLPVGILTTEKIFLPNKSILRFIIFSLGKLHYTLKKTHVQDHKGDIIETVWNIYLYTRRGIEM